VSWTCSWKGFLSTGTRRFPPLPKIVLRDSWIAPTKTSWPGLWKETRRKTSSLRELCGRYGM
jgi:hypothetical protein